MTKVLFVCTGNICRSPMAEVIMLRELEAKTVTDVTVTSAGTGAWDGHPASDAAMLVALEQTLDLTQHKATLVTRELVGESDIILTMSRHHRSRVEELGGQGKTFVLGEYAGRDGPDAEVSDPFGSSVEVYRKTFEEIDELVKAAVERMIEARDATDSR